jgi:hypothetical protein
VKLLIFTYAPAGLGHLRVTDAFVDSRPKQYPYLLLGSYDKFITSMHRFTSVNPIAKWIFTVSQYGLLEDIVTSVYRTILVKTADRMYSDFKEVLLRKKGINEVWVVATHFGMAHQIGAIKDRLMKETGIKIRLVVQVTDDTSQHIWCVRGADLTFVPSLDTKINLGVYSKKKRMNLEYEVIPYPICPALTNSIDPSKGDRQSAFLSGTKKINIAVPISGASVGLPFTVSLIKSMLDKSNRFKFWIIAKKTIYSDMYLSTLSKFQNVHLITGRNDNEMISLYELLYQNNLIHAEITKPSEQSFKAILPPTLEGGSLMLFTASVGRQEDDNISFLIRHGLISNEKGVVPRGIRLPKDAKMAADFIFWGLNSGLFSKMSDPKFKFSEESIESGEVGPDGAKKFWEILDKRFS